jgi:hypothetical protein
LTSFFNDVKICVASYFMYGVSHEGKYCTKFLNQYSFICSNFYKLYKYNINLKHGRQNITLHWINGMIRNNQCIFTKLNAVFILKTAAWTKQYKFLNQYSFICSNFYKLYKYNINISHNKTTGLRNSFNNLNVQIPDRFSKLLCSTAVP